MHDAADANAVAAGLYWLVVAGVSRAGRKEAARVTDYMTLLWVKLPVFTCLHEMRSHQACCGSLPT